jgi:hypothetical protein
MIFNKFFNFFFFKIGKKKDYNELILRIHPRQLLHFTDG